MSAWIFKVFWMPCAVIIGICCFGVLGYLAKEVGWEQPFRWLCLIGALAYIADKVVNP